LASLGALHKTFLLIASSFYLRGLINCNGSVGVNEFDKFPAVSVIIPVRNEERVIEKLFHALSRLIYPQERLEIIFMDDSSTDATGKLIKKYIDDNSQRDIKLITSKQPQSRGKSALLNQGSGLAKNEFLAFYDADTFMAPDSLSRLITVLHKDQKVDIAMGVSLPFCRTTSLLTQLNYVETIYYNWVLLPGQCQLYATIFPSGRNYVARKKSIEEAGGWNENSVGECYELGLRMLKVKRADIRIIPEARSEEVIPENFHAWFSQRIRWNRLNLDATSSFFVEFKDFFKCGSWLKALPNLANHAWDSSFIILFYTILLTGIFVKPGVVFWVIFVSMALVYMLIYSIGYLIALIRQSKVTMTDICRIPLMWLVYQQMIFLSICCAVFLKITRGAMTGRERTEKTMPERGSCRL